jgi:UDP-glucose 4-epimerase
MNTNFNMVKHVVELSKSNGCHLIFASTSDIYGNSKTFKEDDDITMGAPTNPRYSYALSKWHGEQYILNSNIKSTIIRIFGCASPRSSKTWSGGHIPLFVNRLIRGEDIEIHGDGLQTRSISHAMDIAKGFTDSLLRLNEIHKEIINLGTDQQTSVKYVAEYIANKTGNKGNIIYIPTEKIFGNYNEIMVRFANTEKAKKILNYKVNYTTEQVIDEIIASYEKNSSDNSNLSLKRSIRFT